MQAGRLRAAGLELTAGAAPMSPAHRKKLDALEQALDGCGPQDAATGEIVDPGRHLLRRWDYRGDVPGGIPCSLGDGARSSRRGMVADDVAEHRAG